MRWLTEYSREFLSKDYLINGQSPESRVRDICDNAEGILSIKGYSNKLYSYMEKGWLSFSTPIWCNFGLDRGLPISCFGSYIDDSMPSILNTASEVGMMTKYGGGTSAYFGKLRSRGSKITNNGASSGPVHFMQIFDNIMNVISQGSSRRGNFAAYLDIDHPDIMEFLALRSEGNKIQDMSFGVCVPDYWLNDMKNGDGEKRKIWARLLQRRVESGFPYIFFTDNVNNNTVDVYKDKNLKIHASNLCVTGDQRVVSNRGLLTAKELYEQGGDLLLFDNNKIVKSSPMKLIEKNADVFKITLENGMHHTVTKYHKLVKKIDRDLTENVECKDLNIGDSIAIQTKRGLFGQIDMEREAFLLGLYQLNFEKGYVPSWIWESNEETQWQYIRGLYYSDGTVFKSSSKEEPIQISLASIDKEFLTEIQIILANLGTQSSIRMISNRGENLLPKDCYRLIIGNKNDAIIFNSKTNFLNRKGINIEDREYRDNTKKFYNIQSIEYVGKEDVYCVSVESDEHHWICNGFITHNCSEILLPSDSNNSFVCDLSSLNLLHYDEWKDTDLVETVVFLLDSVMTEFIEKSSKIEHMHRAVKFAETHRALGLGVIGWHHYLQSNMIPYESMEAKNKNVKIAKDIHNKSYKASAKLAEIYGEPELLKGYGRRNTTLLAIAPTKSSAFIIGQTSESTEIEKSNYYIKDLAKIKVSYKNPYLRQVLSKYNMDCNSVWASILENNGSVQHLAQLTDREKEVFKTSWEISPKEVIIQAAQRQKYIDQGQSLNIMIHPKTPIKDLNKLILDAWEMGIKTLYYQYSMNAAQEFNRDLLECKSCEG